MSLPDAMNTFAEVEAVFPDSHLVKHTEVPMPSPNPLPDERLREGVLNALRSAYKLVAAQQEYAPVSAHPYLISALEHIRVAAGMVKTG